jgi:hypothetical protein
VQVAKAESNANKPVSRDRRENEKEEFPGLMKDMLPGNSFPQICVVSVNESVEKPDLTQGHGRAVALSNLQVYSSDNRRREPAGGWRL